MKILALDIASNMGIAVGPAGGDFRELKAWSIHLGEPPEDRRFSQLARATVALLDRFNPDLVAGETPVGGKDASAYLIGLEAIVRAMCWNRGVAYKPAHISTVRKHVCGRAWATRDFPGLSKPAAKKAIKAKVMARCRMLGIEVEDDDAADAAAIHCWASATFCGALAPVPGDLFHQEKRPTG